MQNADIFNAATAPLTFHDFLERMRHPSAADLVRSIKSFIVSFSNNAPNPEKDSRSVQEFLVTMEEAFRAHPLWAGATEDELDSAGEGLEKYLMTKLFNHAFGSLPEDAKHDQELSEKMSLVQQFIRPEHLDIQPNFQNETSWLLAQKELQKINTYKAPRDKLVCILNCCRVINNLLLNVSMATNDNPPGADDFLPVLIYVTIKANPPQLHSNLLYIQQYRRQSRLVSEAAYFFTNLVSAESFIKNMDAKSLSMDEREFEKNMQTAKLLFNGTTSQADYPANHSAAEAVQFMSESAISKMQVHKLHQKEGNEELQPLGEYQASAKRPPVSIGNMDKSNEAYMKDSSETSRMSVQKLEEKGAAAVLHAAHTGQLIREYPFLYASAGDLRVEDVEALLVAYKELVLKYVSLSKEVESSSSHKGQIAFKGDVQSRQADSDVSKKERDRNDQKIMSAPTLSTMNEGSGGSDIKHSNQELTKNVDEDGLQLGTELDHTESQLFSSGSRDMNGEVPASDRIKTIGMEVTGHLNEGGSGLDHRTENGSTGDVVSVSDSDSVLLKAGEQSFVTSADMLFSEVAPSNDKGNDGL
jgi:hypothetical protein